MDLKLGNTLLHHSYSVHLLLRKDNYLEPCFQFIPTCRLLYPYHEMWGGGYN